MPRTATYRCQACGGAFEARTADRARGWARYCSKRCKAVQQVRGSTAARQHHGRQRQHKAPAVDQDLREACEAMAAREFGWTPEAMR